MNERIQELAQRVDLLGQFVPTKKPGRYVGYITEEQILEFAELIVRECMNAVCDPSTTYLESMTNASAMYTARERIRKHFRS